MIALLLGIWIGVVIGFLLAGFLHDVAEADEELHRE